MIPLDTLLVFLTLAFALAAVPGPDNIFVLTQSALHGRLAGLTVTLGLASGLFFHTTAVAFGVAIIIQTSAYAFGVLKIAGAAYLVYLAYKSFRASNAQFQGDAPAREPLPKLFLRGLIMNVANPKITLFFLAFLPQFADPAHGSMVAQFYQLGGVMWLMTLVVFGSVALAAGYLGDWLKSSTRAQIWINRASGVVFIALAAKLVFTQKA